MWSDHIVTQVTLIEAGHSYHLPDASLKSVLPSPSKSVTCSFCQMAEFFGQKLKLLGAGIPGAWGSPIYAINTQGNHMKPQTPKT